MRKSDEVEIPMEANDSSWKAPCYRRLQELLGTWFGSSAKHIHNDIVEDTMSHELYYAVRDENEDVNKFLLVLEKVCREKQLDCSTILCQTTPIGDSLLHVATEYGRKKIAELLVENNRLLNVVNIRRDTPLHVAARSKNIEMMKMILSKFEDASSNNKDDFIMSVNKVGNTALHEAILSKNLEGLNLILSKQSESTWPLYWDTHPADSPMSVAVQIGDVEILRRLLQIPFPSDRVIYNSQGNSPLHAAISESNIDLLKEMVDKKEELMHLRDEEGGTPLQYAAYTGYVDGVHELLNKSTLIAFQRNSNGDLPIHIASARGHVMVVKELLQVEWAYTRFWLNNKGQNILHVAAKNGENHMVRFLLNHSKIQAKNVNEKDLNGDTPLHLASRKLYLWTLYQLSLDKRININLDNDQGLTALDIVQTRSKFSMTRLEQITCLILRACGASCKQNELGIHPVANKAWNVDNAGNALIIVAVLVATVTFAAGFTVVGGVNSSDHPVPKQRGRALLADQTLFQIFMAFNTLAMYCSTVGTIILLATHLIDRRVVARAYYLSEIFVHLALIAMPVAFMAATRLVVSNNTFLENFVTVIAFIFTFFILLLAILEWFPYRTSLPFYVQVGGFFLRIGLTLFYGRNDNIMYDVGEILQNEQHGIVNKSMSSKRRRTRSPSVLCDHDQ